MSFPVSEDTGRPGDLDIRDTIVIVTVILLGLATISALLRVFVRTSGTRRWGTDDWATMISYLFVLTHGIIVCVDTRFGLGKSIQSSDVGTLAIGARVSTAGVVFYHAGMAATTMAFLLQYRRVFPLPKFRRFCDAMLVVVLLFGISQVVVGSLQCIPFSQFRTHGQCVHAVAWWHANAAINLVLDIIILIMPMPHLRRLPLPTKQRIILMAIFGLGTFTCAISIIRVTTLVRASKSQDVTYYYSISALWANVELCCAIICVCTPTLRPLLYMVRSWFASMRFRPTWPKRRPLSGGTTNTELSGLTLKPDSLDQEQHQKQEQEQRKNEAGEAKDHYPSWTACIPGETGTDVEAGPGENVPQLRTPPRLMWHDSFRSRISTGTQGSSTPLWMGGSLPESDDDLDLDRIDLHDDELPTLLYPPPRSHVQRRSTATSGGGGESSQVGVADSPILKPVDPKDLDAE